MKENKFNVSAILSVVFSVISIFVVWMLGPIGIGVGIRALREIKEKNEKGKVLAIIGIIIGAISLGLYLYGRIANMK